MSRRVLLWLPCVPPFLQPLNLIPLHIFLLSLSLSPIHPRSSKLLQARPHTLKDLRSPCPAFLTANISTNLRPHHWQISIFIKNSREALPRSSEEHLLVVFSTHTGLRYNLCFVLTGGITFPCGSPRSLCTTAVGTKSSQSLTFVVLWSGSRAGGDGEISLGEGRAPGPRGKSTQKNFFT